MSEHAARASRRLTPKQERFVQEYLVDLNAAAAARRAGYSERTANRIAAENLTKPDIAAAVAEQRKLLSERTARTVDEVLADIGRVRMDAMQMVTTENGTQRMLSHRDAIKALELEGRHLGLFEKDNMQRTTPPEPDWAVLIGQRITFDDGG